jgi:hypothetical protein
VRRRVKLNLVLFTPRHHGRSDPGRGVLDLTNGEDEVCSTEDGIEPAPAR